MAADYVPLTNLRGPAARIAEVTTETTAPGTLAQVFMTGPDQNRKFDFKIPRGAQGLPGVNGVENDEAMALLVDNEESETRTAISASFGWSVLVTDPRFGAKGDGLTDDTAAIQAAIDFAFAQGGATVVVPPGVYMIDADAGTSIWTNAGGIQMRDGITFQIGAGATLKAKPVTTPVSKIIRLVNCSDVTITGGGTIDGNRDNAIVTTGEWGYGISLAASENIVIDGIRTINCWGDGINLQRLAFADYTSPVNVTIRNVVSDNNRRQGLSVEDGIGVLIEDSVFSNTNGALPECGIDIEPPDANGNARDVTIRKCTFRTNARRGITVAESADIAKVIIEDCVFDGNGHGAGGAITDQFRAVMGNSGLTISGCKFIGSLTEDCLRIDGPKDGARIINNEIDRSIYLYGTAILASGFPVGTIVSGNTINGTIKCQYQSFVSITDNTILPPSTGNGIDFTGTINTNHAKVSGNMIRGGVNAIKLSVTSSSMITGEIVNNIMINQRDAAMIIAGRNLIIAHNIIVGACLDSGTASVALVGDPNGSPYIAFEDNSILKAPYGSATINNTPAYAFSKTGTILSARIRRNRVDASFAFSDGVPPTGSGTIFANDDLPVVTTAQRPVSPPIGTSVFDATLGKPIWRKSSSAWGDATGATV
ncbi:glycosyl hydrolase family 28-related protein [Microbacterium sp. NPDC087592]|uniref:glycosyl hydrolase family 28-related protein n=1 Tax=Microbacterium sp. NPDC087592 TaxID=3364193 RepID=UPI003829448E